jgi:LysM repeat protein
MSACAGNTPAVTQLAPPVPYRTATFSDTPTVIPVLTGISLPTPTTFTYSVVEGDTLNEIASRYGITLEALIAANPWILPSALPVGTKLIIPSPADTPIDNSPIPVPLPILQARCWPELSGGSWCFALLHNEYAETLENISIQFTLLDTSGHALTSQTSFGLLDILPSGQTMPLVIHFPPPLSLDVSVQVQVLSAIRLLPGDTRYLPVILDNTLTRVDSSGRTAQVSGRVVLTGSGIASTVWVLAIAYDSTGIVVGVRRWESQSSLTVDTPLSFDFMVSSVGSDISRVDFLAEARP